MPVFRGDDSTITLLIFTKSGITLLIFTNNRGSRFSGSQTVLEQVTLWHVDGHIKKHSSTGVYGVVCTHEPIDPNSKTPLKPYTALGSFED